MWYEIELDADDNDTFFVTVPAFPEVSTFGESQPEALENGRKAIEEAIAARIADGDPLPVPLEEAHNKEKLATGPCRYFVEVPALVYLKAALYMTCRAKKISRAELARRLNCGREHVDRLFRLAHNSKLSSLEDAFKAIDVPLRICIDIPAAA